MQCTDCKLATHFAMVTAMSFSAACLHADCCPQAAPLEDPVQQVLSFCGSMPIAQHYTQLFMQRQQGEVPRDHSSWCLVASSAAQLYGQGQQYAVCAGHKFDSIHMH